MRRWNAPNPVRPKVSSLVTRIRLRLSDPQAVKFSDYELITALSDAVHMLWVALAESFSTVPRVTEIITLRNGAAALPGDFYSLISASEGARVYGMTVEGPGDTVEITYNRVPGPLGGLDDYADVPVTLALDAVEMASSIAGGDVAGAAGIAAATAKRVSGKRERCAVRDGVPFP